MGLEQTSPKKGGPSSRWELRITGKMDCSGERARTASESPAPREHLENLGWAGLLLIRPEINKSAASSPWVYGALTGSLRDHALPCLKRSWGQYSFLSEVGPQPVCVSQPSSDQTTRPCCVVRLSARSPRRPTHTGAAGGQAHRCVHRAWGTLSVTLREQAARQRGGEEWAFRL